MGDAILPFKVCTKCGQSKLATTEFFNRHKLGSGGLNPRCKACRSIEQKEYIESGGREIYKKWRARNIEYIKAAREHDRVNGKKKVSDAKYHAKNSQKNNANRKMRYEANKAQHLETSYKWKKKNLEKFRQYQLAYQKKILKTPKGKVCRAINVRLRMLFAGQKCERSWREIFGYSYDQLKSHIEKQFSGGMSWENYGEWHIDHITPVGAFEFDSIDDPTVKQCWCLSNLRPLWAIDNMRKGAKIQFLI